ncbi:hypothetical protein MTF65_14295 [Streptomyces sp. APSN-46.1]|uniref:hypothetical protein n=1 Tax=Streptomyces sp. APSN-46.1 TaxID=2929049 RepID=UPI001FB543B2|nr:hypothetical protein [Streptomyces sp. APSN-46.1]MCJ1678497.1 hypothetical protein [Streptomyces sp. APSN-46.1]
MNSKHRVVAVATVAVAAMMGLYGVAVAAPTSPQAVSLGMSSQQTPVSATPEDFSW